MIIDALVHAAYDTCLYLCENDKFANLHEISSGFDITMRFRDWRQSSREAICGEIYLRNCAHLLILMKASFVSHCCL